jgi:predicted phosphodiesterase
MIIDDRKDRQLTYDSALAGGEFELLYIWTRSEFEKYKETPVDGYVIDVFLDKGDWKDINAATLLREEIQNAPRPAPVVLVSQVWHDPRVLDVLKEAGDTTAKVVQYLAWPEFVQAATKGDEGTARRVALTNKLQFELDRWHGRSGFRPAPDDTIRILLLADLQYGDPHTDRKATWSESWIARTFAHRKEQVPDLIVLAGDVSYSGSPEQFALAEERIADDLMATLWDKNNVDRMRDRIVLVPGNHDVNLRFSACDDYAFNLNKKELERMPSAAALSFNSKEFARNGWHPTRHHEYALEPFRRFAQRLTGDANWARSPSLCWVDRRFAQCGIRFFGINSVSELNAASPDYASFDEKALRDIDRSVGANDSEGVFSIAVSHHGLRPDGAKRTEIDMANWAEKGCEFFKIHGINLWMYGHYHEFDTPSTNSGPFFGSPLWRIQAPTPRITAASTTRGFCVVDLHRKAGKVVDAFAIHYPFASGKVGDPQSRRVFGLG